VGLLLLVAAGVAFAEWNGRRAQGRLREDYLRRIQTAALALDAAAIGRLAIAASDSGSADFLRVSDQLTQLRRLNSDVAYVYLWTLRGPNIVYVAEGRGLRNAEVAAPGESYRPTSDGDRQFFFRHEPFLAGPFRDEWGTFVSANALVVPLGSSVNRCWLAFDIEGTQWTAADRNSRLLGMALTVLAAAMFVGAGLFRVRRLEADANSRARLRAEAAAAERNLLLAKVSHELRTPLQTMLGCGELLEKEPLGNRGRAQLAALRQEGRQMLRLVEDLLDLGSIEAGEFRMIVAPMDLPRLVRETVAGLQTRAEAKGLGLDCRIDSEVPVWVAGDAVRIRQIIVNLTANALKFTSEGRVDVTVGIAQEVDGVRKIQISVRDTGPGIPPERQNALFQPFSRLETSGGNSGAGLGLALVAALCRGAGGTVTLESDGRRGACFRVRLPLPQVSAPASDPVRVPDGNLAARRLLVVDDNRLIRELFVGYLRELGAECTAAADGEEALRLAASSAFDAAVIDLALPGIDGAETARRLRRGAGTVSALRIVGVSAHARATDRSRAISAGMDAFLVKPVVLADLAAAVRVGAETPAIPVVERLQGQIELLFRSDAERQTRAVEQALATGNWREVRTCIHYLKNSAAAVRDLDLYAACAAVETAAESGDAAAIVRAWRETEPARRRWLPA
jgi:signal transduction histidine kinase/CheY-like chemotaxis protein